MADRPQINKRRAVTSIMTCRTCDQASTATMAVLGMWQMAGDLYLVELTGCELRVVRHVNALISELLAQLIHPVHTSNDLHNIIAILWILWRMVASCKKG